ncbi:hypothetical protein BDZ89DRAFT_1160905 [Hymenopellis radicata]|nr:hypothetical protein BDZ89DRAFT_1160905 [Hymenopellis radicata]
MSLSAEGESRVRRFKALFRGRTKADIVLDLKRIDLDVTALLLRFMIKGLVRTEVSATNALSLTKQFRDEVHLRLDSIESRLKQQTSDNGPGGLLGRGTVTAVRGSLADSTTDLRKSSNWPSEIQHSKHALPDSSRKRKGRDDEWEGDEDGTSHPYQSDLPSQRNEDVTLDLAEALLSASKLPYLPQQVADRAVVMSRELGSETKRSDSTDEAHINPTPISAVDAVERNSDSHDYNHASDEGHFLCCT